MRIIIKTKNLSLSEELKKFIEKKVFTLKRFISVLKEDTIEGRKTLAEVLVDVEKESMHHKKGEIFKSRIEINLPGKKLVASAKGEDLERAILDAKEQIKEKIREYKLKKIDRVRRQQRKTKKELRI